MPVRPWAALAFAGILSAIAAPSGILPAPAQAEAEHSRRTVAFTKGHANIRGRIKGYHFIDYIFQGGSGESLNVTMHASNNACYFNLLAPGETEVAFFIGSTSGDSYHGTMPTSGNYMARIYLMRSAARRKETCHFTLQITLGGKQATNEKGPDYADGLTGGPDFWQVTGVAADDMLNIRKDASANGALVTRVANGTILRNLGCKNSRGQRWCRVEQAKEPNTRGWVNGLYLREASGPR